MSDIENPTTDSERGAAVDPTTVEILRNQLHDIAEEMQSMVMQSAYSPLWQEGGDLSCILLSKDVEIIGRSERAIPIHIATQMSATEAAIEQVGGYENLHEGDVLFHNDPYSGNNHLNDFLTVQPVFVDDTLVGFSSDRGHWIDVGGMSPSSYGTDTGELIKEGIRVPPTKLYERGKLNEGLYRTVLSNVRNPEMREVDFKAQLAGLRRGHARLETTAEKYGVDTVLDAVDTVLSNEERTMQRRISELPDGTYTAEDYIDGDGVGDEITKIQVTVEVADSNLKIDFTGTDDQVYGGVNTPFGVTKTAAYYACKVALNPGPPGTSGIYRPVTVTAPEGCLVNPRYPAPVACGNHETASRVYDVVVKALGTIDPDIAFGAGAGSSNGFSFTHLASGRMGRNRTIGGLGACVCRDGINGIRSAVGNTAIQSFERTEEDYDFITTEEFTLVEDSGGAGEHRGGNSVRRTMRYDEDVRMVLTAERTKVPPFGVCGGQSGTTGEYVHVSPDGERTVTKSKFDMEMAGGSRLVAKGPGAGGYGDPEKRPPERVLEDVKDEYVSVETARAAYKVAIDPERLEIDREETERLRNE